MRNYRSRYFHLREVRNTGLDFRLHIISGIIIWNLNRSGDNHKYFVDVSEISRDGHPAVYMCAGRNAGASSAAPDCQAAGISEADLP